MPLPRGPWAPGCNDAKPVLTGLAQALADGDGLPYSPTMILNSRSGGEARAEPRRALAHRSHAVLLIFVAISCSPSVAPADPVVDHLSNGATVLYLPARSVPMFSSTILVPAGSAWETPETNGAAHFLEHLLFNGTATRSREQIYATTDLLGAYNNASTQRERTVFQLLLPSENWKGGLELQADMLLHSTLPPEMFEKEKGIILEELAKDRTNPDYEVERFRERSLFGDDPRALPVLGTEESIEAMSLESVQRFYQHQYAPGGFTIVLMGDFDIDAARAVIRDQFGDDDRAAPVLPARPAFPEGHQIRRRPAPKLGRTSMAIELPLATEDLAAARVLETLLTQGEQSAISRALEANGVTPMAAGFTVDFGEPWSRVTVSVDLPEDTKNGDVAGVPTLSWILAHLARFAEIGPSPAEVGAARTACVVEEVSLREKMHYYGLMRADLLGSAGPSRTVSLAENVSGDPRVYADLVGEALATGRILVSAQGAIEDGPAEFDELPAAESASWLTDHAAAAGPVSSPTTRPTSLAAHERVVLPNGLTLIHQSSPETRTFAAHFLFRDRSRVEDEVGVPHGTADVLHRILGRATEELSEDQLRGRLNECGATIKTTDLDWIPYDDYYFSPEFSYVRLETIDLFGLDALRLALEIVRHPSLTQPLLDDAIAAAAARAEKDAARPSEVAERGFYRALKADAPQAHGVLGDASALRAITLEQVASLHRRLMAPENLILTIASNLPLDEVRRVVTEAFPETAAPGPTRRDPPTLATNASAKTVVRDVGQEQSFVILGEGVRVKPTDEPSLRVATAILSERLADRLREREGLAYSIGATYRRDAPPSVQMRAGTRPENLERMERGMRRVAADLRAHAPTREQIEGARNREEGRRRMRRLTRIGQAFAMGMAEYRGGDPFALDSDLELLRSVTPKDVTHAATEYLAFDHSILSIAR